jgi:NAD(P)-dependent dehydrogenase (short-subunit alcohol dehydrogenase family)
VQKRVCLITGATEGIGKATAIELARAGFTVVLGARDAAKAEAVKNEIVASTANRDTDYIIADLRSLKQVGQLAQTFKQRHPRLDVLINNAGVFMPAGEMTEDGHEATFQVNYLSQFYLTHLLLDELKNSGQGRIINLSSSVYAAGKFDLHNPHSERRFSTFSAYSDSKLLMLLFTIELAERLKGTRVTANAVHPGIVRTQMLLRAPGAFRIIAYLALPFAISPQKGAATTVHLASSPEVKDISGKYFTRCRATNIKTAFNSRDNRSALWDLSMRSAPAAAPARD